MATIVQPYNAWREQLAANFLGPLLGNMINQGIQRSRDAEQNRKQNAFYDTVMQSLNAGQQKDLLTGQPMPEGYDNNGWAKSFHSMFTPITQYDMGTDPLTQNTAKSIPTALDVMNAVSQNLATPRFGMLNRDNAMKMFEPYIRANEYERAKQQRQGVLDSYSNAATPQAQYDALFGGLIRGDIDKDILSSWSDMYKYNNPYLQAGSVNTGDKVNMYAFNPVNGQFTFDKKNSFPVGMTPYQAANLNLDRDKLNFDKYKFAYPNQNILTVDGGDSKKIFSTNPRTGEITQQGEVENNISPYQEKVLRQNDLATYYQKKSFDSLLVEQRTKQDELFKILAKIDKNNKEIATLGEWDSDYKQELEFENSELREQYEIVKKQGAEITKQIHAKAEEAKAARGGANPVASGELPPVPEQYRPDANVDMLSGQPISSDVVPSIASPDVTSQADVLSSDATQQTQQRAKYNAYDAFGNIPFLSNENDLLTLPTVTATPQAQPQKGENQSRIIEENGKKYFEFNIPDELFYDESRDKDIPSGNIATKEDLIKWLGVNINPNDPKLSADNLVKYLFKKKYRIRK